MAVTLAEAQEFRAAWKAAYLAVSTGQSYTIGSRTLTRADLAETRAEFLRWDQAVDQLTNGSSAGPRAFRVIPRDL